MVHSLLQRLLTESQKDSLAKDFQTLNLSKYVEEAVSAILEISLSNVYCGHLKRKIGYGEEGRICKSSFKKNESNIRRYQNLCYLNMLNLLLSTTFLTVHQSKFFISLLMLHIQASAIADAKLKMSDVQCAVYLCSLIHQRYATFSPYLLENFHKYLLSKKDEGKVILLIFSNLCYIKKMTHLPLSLDIN